MENEWSLEGVVTALPVLLANCHGFLALRGGSSFPPQLLGSTSNAPGIQNQRLGLSSGLSVSSLGLTLRVSGRADLPFALPVARSLLQRYVRRLSNSGLAESAETKQVFVLSSGII